MVFTNISIATLGIASLLTFGNISSIPGDPVKETKSTSKPEEDRPLALVNYDYFEQLVSEVKGHRAKRMVSLEEFQAKSLEENTLILDTRSKEMYDKKHIKGAIHLNFADFNIWSLDSITKAHGGKDAQVLIYCNNNFWVKPKFIASILDGKYPKLDVSVLELSDQAFIGKGTSPMYDAKDIELLLDSNKISDSIVAQPPKPETKATVFSDEKSLALNIPTYINLYGYGYRNIFELKEMIDVNDSAIEFEGTAVHD
jgi:hypothetical protein